MTEVLEEVYPVNSGMAVNVEEATNSLSTLREGLNPLSKRERIIKAHNGFVNRLLLFTRNRANGDRTPLHKYFDEDETAFLFTELNIAFVRRTKDDFSI